MDLDAIDGREGGAVEDVVTFTEVPVQIGGGCVGPRVGVTVEQIRFGGGPVAGKSPYRGVSVDEQAVGTVGDDLRARLPVVPLDETGGDLWLGVQDQRGHDV